MSGSRALLIVNRKSREGEADLDAGLDLLRRRGVDLKEIYLEDAGEIEATIRRFSSQVDFVILGGGDGTMNAAAAALVETGLPLGVLPMGTANDLARTLQIPTLLPEACRVIAEGRVHRIDLGRVNGKYFFNVASIGLGVRVTHRLSPEIKRKWGVIGYLRCLLGAIKENRSFRADIICEGRHFRHRSIQVAVGNGRHYGGGMTIAADASLDDQRLHLYSLKPQSLWQLILLAPALRRGEFPRRERVLLLSGKRMEVRTRAPLPVDTDGELTSETPARFEVVKEALSVFIPEGYRRGEGKDAA